MLKNASVFGNEVPKSKKLQVSRHAQKYNRHKFNIFNTMKRIKDNAHKLKKHVERDEKLPRQALKYKAKGRRGIRSDQNKIVR